MEKLIVYSEKHTQKRSNLSGKNSLFLFGEAGVNGVPLI
jgi:hypothetical protein